MWVNIIIVPVVIIWSSSYLYSSLSSSLTNAVALEAIKFPVVEVPVRVLLTDDRIKPNRHPEPKFSSAPHSNCPSSKTSSCKEMHKYTHLPPSRWNSCYYPESILIHSFIHSFIIIIIIIMTPQQLQRHINITRLAREAEEMEIEMIGLTTVTMPRDQRRYMLGYQQWYRTYKIVIIGIVVAIAVAVAVIFTNAGTAASNKTPASFLSLKSPEELRQIAVACHFINSPNLTECVAITRVDWSTVGNTIPTEIGLLTQLAYWYLHSQLTGTIPSTFGQLSALTYLYWQSSHLTGTIPSTFGSLTQLGYLDLSRNQLTGTIPSSFGSLTQLRYLDLSRNHLTGTIPSTLRGLTRLYRLDLSINHLNGTIPSSFGSLTKLQYLALPVNQLTGTISSSLGSLTQLTELSLSRNHLTGTIPSTLGNFEALITLDLSNITQLTGTIPYPLCRHNRLTIYIDCANVECTCCRGRNSGGYDAGPCPSTWDPCFVERIERTHLWIVRVYCSGRLFLFFRSITIHIIYMIVGCPLM